MTILQFSTHRCCMFFWSWPPPKYLFFQLDRSSQPAQLSSLNLLVVFTMVNANPGLKVYPKYKLFLYKNIFHSSCFCCLRLFLRPNSINRKSYWKVKKLKSKFSLILVYLNQALNNPAQELWFYAWLNLFISSGQSTLFDKNPAIRVCQLKTNEKTNENLLDIYIYIFSRTFIKFHYVSAMDYFQVSFPLIKDSPLTPSINMNWNIGKSC